MRDCRGRRDFSIREPALNLNRPAAHWTARLLHIPSTFLSFANA